jgi:hypothetical protein
MELRDILARTVSQHSGRNSRRALESPGGFRWSPIHGERGGDAESGICVFQPHWQVQSSFTAWKLPENQNGSTDFSNIYYWLDLIN